MKLIVGLGNPGEKYVNTRHNAGFIVLDDFTRSNNIEWSADGNFQFSLPGRQAGIFNFQFVVAKPQTFMNESGKAVRSLCQKHKLMPENVLVIHDDLDIPLGSYKLQFGKGPKLHNGVDSVESGLGTKNFWRFRVGVENRRKNQESRIKGEDYVLQDFTDEERKILSILVKEKIAPEVKKWLLKV